MEAAIIPGYQIRNPAYLPIHDPIPGESQLDMILLKKCVKLIEYIQTGAYQV